MPDVPRKKADGGIRVEQHIPPAMKNKGTLNFPKESMGGNRLTDPYFFFDWSGVLIFTYFHIHQHAACSAFEASLPLQEALL